jgi:hypothetical protein
VPSKNTGKLCTVCRVPMHEKGGNSFYVHAPGDSENRTHSKAEFVPGFCKDCDPDNPRNLTPEQIEWAVEQARVERYTERLGLPLAG